MAVVSAISDLLPDLGSERLATFGQVVDDAVTALTDRDILPDGVFQALYGSMSRAVPFLTLNADPLAALLGRSQYPIARIARELERNSKPVLMQVLLERPTRTLEEIARDLGVTRERIRQIESKAIRMAKMALLDLAPELAAFWRQRLEAAAVSEAELIEPFIDGERSRQSQILLGRALLRSIDARNPATLRERGIGGWWTLRVGRLAEIATELETVFPCSGEHLDELLGDFPLGEARALKELFGSGWRGIRRHQLTGSWVHAGASDRDAAYLLLTEEARPMSSEELSERLGMSVRNVAAHLMRDDRFRQIKPSGFWTPAESSPRDEPSTTLETVLDVLQTEGPLALAELTALVRERYPVTPVAVNQCLNHHLIGLTDYGLVDLVERGAKRQPRKEPRKPDDVILESGGRLRIIRPVDRDLLRGSGLGISPYVSWFLGLESAPSSRRFEIDGFDTIRVKYSVNGSSISSLKSIAEGLDARLGCELELILDPVEDRAVARLDCGHNHQNGSTH